MTRPYEGLLLCLPVAVVLARWTSGQKSASGAGAVRAPLCRWPIIATVRGWATTTTAPSAALDLPYTVDRATYAVAPYYIWQHPRRAPAYRHEEPHLL